MSINLIPFHKKLLDSCCISPDSYLPNWVKKALDNNEMLKYCDLFNPDISFKSDLDSDTVKKLDKFVLSIIDIKKADKTIKIPKNKYALKDFISNESLIRLLNNKNIITLEDLSAVGFYRLVNSYGNFGITKVLYLINDICHVDHFGQDSTEINYKKSNELISKYIIDFKIPLNELSINDPRFFDIKNTLSIYIDQNEDGEYFYSILKSLSNEFSTDKIEQILSSIQSITNKIDLMSLQDQMEDFFISYIQNTHKNTSSMLERFNLIRERLGINASKENSYTLEQVGKLAGVTRERIRQLETKILVAVKYTDDEIYVPKLIEINNYLKQNLHNDIDFISEELSLLGHGKWNISRLLGCLDLFKIKNNYQIVEDILCADGDEILVKHILTTAKKIVSYNGLVEINQLNLAINRSMSTEIDTIKKVLQSEFVEVEDGWFYIERSSNLLISIAKRMANFSKEFPAQDLREGHRKYAKNRSSGFAAESAGRLFYGFITPSSSAIKKLFENHIDDFHVIENNIVCNTFDNSFLINNEGEATVDSQFLNYFRARNFEPATMSELQKFFIVDNGMSEGTFHIYLTYRPYTKQYSRSVWGIVGHPPSELTLENTINRIQKNPPTKTEWAQSGEVKYKLRASSGVGSLAFAVGKDFADILGEHSYKIYHNNEIYCEIKRSRSFWYGAGKYLSNILFCEFFDYLAFYFNTKDYSVRVEIISEAEYDE